MPIVAAVGWMMIPKLETLKAFPHTLLLLITGAINEYEFMEGKEEFPLYFCGDGCLDQYIRVNYGDVAS